MTKQRNRPSLGQAALMTGLLGVGGWLASSALASNDANASEMPPDPSSYTGTALSDAGSVDLTQLSNSVLDQVAQLRANGHDFSVDVVQQASDQDQIPAALRRPSDQDSKSRKAWNKAGQQVADTPATRVLPRSSTPVVTPTVPTSSSSKDNDGTDSVPVKPSRHSDSASEPVMPSQASAADSVPVTPTGHTHGRSRVDDANSAPSQSEETPASTSTDRRDDQNAHAASLPPITAIPVGDVPVAPSTDANGSEPPTGDSPTGSDDNDPAGTTSEPRIGIPDGAKQRARLGSNNKDSLEPGEIKDTGVQDTLFSREQDISKAIDEVRKDLPSGKAPTETAELPQAPEAMPESASDSPVSDEPNLADIMSQVPGWVSGETQTNAGTAQPVQGPEVLPGTGTESDPWISGPATAAVVWQQLNERVFNPIKARIGTMQTLRTQQKLQEGVSGRSPLETDQEPYQDPESDATVTEAMVNAGATSANLANPDADLGFGEMPVSELPSPPRMRPVGWRANQATPDPNEEANKPMLSDKQQERALAERDANGRTGFVESKGSIGSKQSGWSSQADPETESDATDSEQPLTREQVQEVLDQRDAKFAKEDARPRLSIGNYRSSNFRSSSAQAQQQEWMREQAEQQQKYGGSPEPAEQQQSQQQQANSTSESAPAPKSSATTTSQAQEEADAEAMAASEAQEQAALNEEGAAIKANGERAQEAEQANVAASQAQNAALQQQEQRHQADEAATQQEAEAGEQRAAAQTANAEAAQEQANQAAAFQEQQQEQAAAALSRPAGGSDDSDLAGTDDGEVAVPETEPNESDTSGDSNASDGVDEGTGSDGGNDAGEVPTRLQQSENEMLGINGGGETAEEGGEAVIEG